MTWMDISCGKCGHVADIGQFTSTPLGGNLPDNTYQCPACQYAIQRRAAPGKHYDSGLYVPGAVRFVQVDARL